MKKKLSVFFIVSAMYVAVIGMLFVGVANKKVFATNLSDLTLSSQSAYLFDDATHTVMYQKNETEHKPIASMCKIMTLNLCFDQIRNGTFSLEDSVNVSENASNMGGSQVFLSAGSSYPVKELIKSVIVSSANDASVALAEYVSGSEQNFVNEMNNKAKQLNMNDTVFVNCTGLPQDGQYSCAKDVAIMMSYLIKNPEYFNFSKIWTENFKHQDGREIIMTNTNKLVRFYDGCDGGKTGFTKQAGFCLTATAIKNDMRLISVVINAPSSKERFADSSKLLNYGFNNYESKTIVNNSENLNLDVTIENGKKDKLSVRAENPIKIVTKRNEKISVQTIFTPNNLTKAPIKEGDVIGTLSIFNGNIEIAKVNVIASESIEQNTYFDVVKRIIEKWSIID